MKNKALLWVYAFMLLALSIKVFAVPSVSGVIVLPEFPNAGQELLCNYTYSSPDNYTEQNSTFEWWKNGVEQNINSQILDKNNLTVSDKWSCEVTGYDGLDFSTPIKSSNNVTILDTVQNIVMYVNGTNISKETGFFGDKTQVTSFSISFNEELNNALANCTADADGFCDIPITFSSDNAGLLNLSSLGIYYNESGATVTSLAIESITALDTNGTQKIFEFVILNDGGSTVTDIQWQFDTNDSNIISSTTNISSLAPNEKAFVYLQYNFSKEGTFDVNASASGLTASGFLIETVNVGDLIITDFADINVQGTNVIFEIIGKNNLDENISGINLSLSTGDSSRISSATQFSLSPNKTIFIYAIHDYSSKGTYTALANLSNGSLEATKTLSVRIEDLDVKNLSIFDENLTKRIFEIILENTLALNLTNVNWTFDTKNNTIINATSNVILQPNEELFVYIDYNFTGAGTFNVNATARNGTLIDSRNLTISIT